MAVIFIEAELFYDVLFIYFMRGGISTFLLAYNLPNIF